MKIKAGLGVLTAAVALAAPSVASAKTLTYGGSITGADTTAESRIAMDVKVNNKRIIKKVTQLRGVGIPINCEISGKQTANTTIPVSLPVSSQGRFSFDFTDNFGNRSVINGKFKRNGRGINGSFVYANHFAAEGNLPEEDCASPLLNFKVKLGGPDVDPSPTAPAAR